MAAIAATVIQSFLGKQVRTFGTVTKELLRLLDWQRGERITHLATESTGVYWRPLDNLLDGPRIELMVVNLPT